MNWVVEQEFEVEVATFTSFGTSIPVVSTLGEVLVVSEVILGYLMTGLLVAILVGNTIGN